MRKRSVVFAAALLAIATPATTYADDCFTFEEAKQTLPEHTILKHDWSGDAYDVAMGELKELLPVDDDAIEKSARLVVWSHHDQDVDLAASIDADGCINAKGGMEPRISLQLNIAVVRVMGAQM